MYNVYYFRVKNGQIETCDFNINQSNLLLSQIEDDCIPINLTNEFITVKNMHFFDIFKIKFKVTIADGIANNSDSIDSKFLCPATGTGLIIGHDSRNEYVKIGLGYYHHVITWFKNLYPGKEYQCTNIIKFLRRQPNDVLFKVTLFIDDEKFEYESTSTYGNYSNNSNGTLTSLNVYFYGKMGIDITGRTPRMRYFFKNVKLQSFELFAKEGGLSQEYYPDLNTYNEIIPKNIVETNWSNEYYPKDKIYIYN